MYTEEEHNETTRLLQNPVGTLNSFQKHIKNKFSNGSEANKLIELGKKEKIGRINFAFKQKNMALSLKVSQIILVLKLFAGDKGRIDKMMSELSGDGAEKKRKFAEEKKALIA